jgi:4-oxalocrotonate tautomerase
MPHVTVKLWPGKSEQQKARLSVAIVKDVMNVLNYGEESVSVAIEEVTPEDWVEKVFKPDIQNRWDELYKKPGYDPSDLCDAIGAEKCNQKESVRDVQR